MIEFSPVRCRRVILHDILDTTGRCYVEFKLLVCIIRIVELSLAQAVFTIIV